MATSSANPDDLDGWVTASRALDEALSTNKDTLNRLHGEFTGSLGWGQFDASSLLSGAGSCIGCARAMLRGTMASISARRLAAPITDSMCCSSSA